MAKRPGDEEFIAFVAAHSDRLIRTPQLICGDRGRAEDLLQSGRERTYLRWHKVDHDDPCGYVCRAVASGHRDWWRRSRGREQSVPTPPEAVVADQSDDLANRDAVLSTLARLTVAGGPLSCFATTRTGPRPTSQGCWAWHREGTCARALTKLRGDPGVAADPILQTEGRTLDPEETR